MDDDELTDEERSAQVRSALLKALAVVAVIGVLIAIGTTIMVHALGLNDSGDTGPVGASPQPPSKPLPTTALPVPGQKSATPSDEPSESPSGSPAPGAKGDIELSISPINAKPMERVNLTGSYKGADNVQLEVQRFDNGQWANFGVQANVDVGTYATYIQTGHTGENRFRMYDPQSQKGSNVILVTIG
jgi:hypothetical protein